VPDDLVSAPNRILQINHAAGYVGVCVETMRKLKIKGSIPYIPIPGTNRSGFLLSDLDAFILKNRVHRRVWDQDSPEMPFKVAERMLALSTNGLNAAINTGRLQDRTYPSVRNYIIEQARPIVSAEVRATYKAELNRLRCEVDRLRRKVSGEKVVYPSWEKRRKSAEEPVAGEHKDEPTFESTDP
jgi:hypothetical protein